MKAKYKIGTKINCYDYWNTFKGTIRGTGVIGWCNVDGIIKPRYIYLIEGVWDKEKNKTWFEVDVKILDDVDDDDITIFLTKDFINN